jgi:hypothetical protein
MTSRRFSSSTKQIRTRFRFTSPSTFCFPSIPTYLTVGLARTERTSSSVTMPRFGSAMRERACCVNTMSMPRLSDTPMRRVKKRVSAEGYGGLFLLCRRHRTSRVRRRQWPQRSGGYWRRLHCPCPHRQPPLQKQGRMTSMYNKAKPSRVQPQQSSGDARPALHAGARSRLCPTLVALPPMRTLLTTGDRA